MKSPIHSSTSSDGLDAARLRQPIHDGHLTLNWPQVGVFNDRKSDAICGDPQELDCPLNILRRYENYEVGPKQGADFHLHCVKHRPVLLSKQLPRQEVDARPLPPQSRFSEGHEPT